MKGGLVQGRAVAVNLFIKTYQITATQMVSISSFTDMFVPTHNTLILWVSKWYEERSTRVWDQQNAQSVHIPENTNKEEKTMQNPHQSTCQHDLILVINDWVVYQMSHCDLQISHSKLRLCRREWDKAYHAQFSNQSMHLM
jgi:hypothetical protein